MSVRRGMIARLLRNGLPFPGYTPSWIAGQVAVAGALSLVASAMISLLLAPGGLYLAYWQLWLLITAVLLVRWFGRPVRKPPPGTEVAPDPVSDADTADRPYPVAARWQHRLSVTSGDPEWFGRVARDRLAALVAERLRQRHGVRLADPRAEAVLGDELHAFLTAPVTRTPSPAELGRLITRMEQL
jgi:hypothetical protein